MPINWPFRLYRVAGDSMAPTYQAGDVLLGWRWFTPRAGRVVVVIHAGRPLVKRLVSLDAAGAWLQGDNPTASTDSRQFGAVSTNQLIAVIIAKL